MSYEFRILGLEFGEDWCMRESGNADGGVAVEVKDLTKVFGAVTAVDQLSFVVPHGQIAGFVGPNGSGKSTTLRILATLARQDSGMAAVMGMDVRMVTNLRRVRRSIGFMPDYAGLFPGMTAYEFLEFFAAAHRIPADHREGVIDDILALVDLVEKREEPVKGCLAVCSRSSRWDVVSYMTRLSCCLTNQHLDWTPGHALSCWAVSKNSGRWERPS